MNLGPKVVDQLREMLGQAMDYLNGLNAEYYFLGGLWEELGIASARCQTFELQQCTEVGGIAFEDATVRGHHVFVLAEPLVLQQPRELVERGNSAGRVFEYVGLRRVHGAQRFPGANLPM